MAYFDEVDDRYGDYGRPEAPPDSAASRAAAPRLGVLMNWAGALMSLGILVGMSIWAVQLMLRDVSGVPVIAAIEGPMRAPPADPGGTQAPHQGLAVNRIAEGREAQPVPDRLVLAPPPIRLQEVRFETEAPAPVRRDAAAAGLADDPAEAAAPADAEAQPDTTALIERLLREAQPGLSGAAGDAVASVGGGEDAPAIERAAPEPGAEVLPASMPGVARSLRPAARPAAFVTAAPGDAAAAPGTPSATEEIPVADLPRGTRLVQLGAFDTAEIARREWDRIAGRFPEYFDARARVIEEAESGGQSFFRLRAAGFDDLAGSRRFCAVLVAQGTACIPVTVR